ncbi:MAG: YfiR family protein [Vicinamibacteria bacterium]
MKVRWFCSALIVLVGVRTASAAVPFEIQVPLILKALTYDRSLKARVGDQVRIAVLHPAQGEPGASESLTAALRNLPGRTLNGLPVNFRHFTVRNDAVVDQALRDGRWAAAYVMPGFTSQEIAQIRRACESQRVLAMAADADEVERGLAFGVDSRDGKPQLVVNLPSVKAFGSDFDLALLRLSRVIQ